MIFSIHLFEEIFKLFVLLLGPEVFLCFLYRLLIRIDINPAHVGCLIIHGDDDVIEVHRLLPIRNIVSVIGFLQFIVRSFTAVGIEGESIVFQEVFPEIVCIVELLNGILRSYIILLGEVIGKIIAVPIEESAYASLRESHIVAVVVVEQGIQFNLLSQRPQLILGHIQL